MYGRMWLQVGCLCVGGVRCNKFGIILSELCEKVEIILCANVLQSSGISWEVGTIDCEIQPVKGINFFCFLLFGELFNCS